MDIHPLKTKYLKPSEEAVYNYLGKINYFRTVREIALAVGISEELTGAIVCRLVRRGIVQKRRRDYGFDNGILEFKGKSVNSASRRRKAQFHRAVGFEPLHVKMKRLVGIRRAREIEKL